MGKKGGGKREESGSYFGIDIRICSSIGLAPHQNKGYIWTEVLQLNEPLEGGRSGIKEGKQKHKLDI